MSDENHHRELSAEDARLNELIRAAGQGEQEEGDRPDDEAITAYLFGSPTPRQRKLMMGAMLRSAAFRQEMLALAREIERLDKNPPKLEAEGIEAPPLERFLADQSKQKQKSSREAGLWTRLKTAVIPQPHQEGAPVAVFIPRILLPLAAAALVLFLARPLFDSDQRMTFATFEEDVDPGLLVSLTTRSLNADTVIAASAQEAALLGFRSVVAWHGGQFTVGEGAEGGVLPSSGEQRMLRLADRESDTPMELPYRVPVSFNAETDSLIVWLLLLPERSLLRAFVLRPFEASLEVPAGGSELRAVSVTYGTRGEYHLAGVHVLPPLDATY